MNPRIGSIRNFLYHLPLPYATAGEILESKGDILLFDRPSDGVIRPAMSVEFMPQPAAGHKRTRKSIMSPFPRPSLGFLRTFG